MIDWLIDQLCDVYDLSIRPQNPEGGGGGGLDSLI